MSLNPNESEALEDAQEEENVIKVDFSDSNLNGDIVEVAGLIKGEIIGIEDINSELSKAEIRVGKLAIDLLNYLAQIRELINSEFADYVRSDKGLKYNELPKELQYWDDLNMEMTIAIAKLDRSKAFNLIGKRFEDFDILELIKRNKASKFKYLEKMKNLKNEEYDKYKFFLRDNGFDEEVILRVIGVLKMLEETL